MTEYYISLSEPGIYVPSDDPINVITNKDLERMVETSDEWITNMTGMKERRISHNKGVKEMGVEAAKNLLKKTNTNPEEIDEIIFATNRHNLEQEFPCHAGYVAKEIGAKDGIPLSDIGAGCTGLIYAIRQAYNNLLAEDKKIIHALGVERLTDMTDYSDRNTCILFGDGGCDSELRKKERKNKEEGIIKIVLGGEPDRGDAEWPNGFLALQYKKGKKLRPLNKFDPNYSEKKFELYEKEQNYLIMNGKKVFKYATRVMIDAVHEVLKGTNYSINDIDVIIPHGANYRITNASEEGLRKKGFNGDLFTNLNKYGNTSTASIGLAHAEAIEKGIIKPGSLYLLVGFGAGFTWGAALVRND